METDSDPAQRTDGEKKRRISYFIKDIIKLDPGGQIGSRQLAGDGSDCSPDYRNQTCLPGSISADDSMNREPALCTTDKVSATEVTPKLDRESEEETTDHLSLSASRTITKKNISRISGSCFHRHDVRKTKTGRQEPNDGRVLIPDHIPKLSHVQNDGRVLIRDNVQNQSHSANEKMTLTYQNNIQPGILTGVPFGLVKDSTIGAGSHWNGFLECPERPPVDGSRASFRLHPYGPLTSNHLGSASILTHQFRHLSNPMESFQYNVGTFNFAHSRVPG